MEKIQSKLLLFWLIATLATILFVGFSQPAGYYVEVRYFRIFTSYGLVTGVLGGIVGLRYLYGKRWLLSAILVPMSVVNAIIMLRNLGFGIG